MNLNDPMLLDAFVRHAPVALAMFDRDMRYIACSQQWLNDYGLGERDLTGLSHYEVFPEIPEIWKDYHRRGQAGEKLSKDLDPFVREDGRLHWIQWAINPWRNAAGEIGGIVIFSEDVTRYEQALQQISERSASLQALGERALRALAALAAGADPRVGQHQRRVAALARALAAELGWSEPRCQAVELAAWVHDIGLAMTHGPRDEHAAAPTDAALRQHPQAGADLIRSLGNDGPVPDIVLQHHERWDGSGYPAGLHGQQILPAAQVLAVADTLCGSLDPSGALSDAALDTLAQQRDTGFDPTVVDAALRLLRRRPFTLPD